MPDGSERTFRGELNGPLDSMVTSLDLHDDTGYHSNTYKRAAKSLEESDWEHGSRKYSHLLYKRNKLDVHGGQYGLKSCPTVPRERTPIVTEAITDNRLIEEMNKRGDVYSKHNKVEDEKDSFMRKKEVKHGDQESSMIKGSHWKPDMPYTAYLEESSIMFEKCEKNVSNNDTYNQSLNKDKHSFKCKDREKVDSNKYQIGKEKKSPNSHCELKKQSLKYQGEVPKGSLKSDDGVDKMTHKYEKEQNEKLHKCKMVESDFEEKVGKQENLENKLTEKTGLTVKVLTKDKNRREENRKLSNDDDDDGGGNGDDDDDKEEDTLVKRMVDPMYDTSDVDEKQDEPKSLGFSVQDDQYDHCSSLSDQKSLKINVRTVEEDSWYNSVSEDSNVTKDTSIEYTTHDSYYLQKESFYKSSDMYGDCCEKHHEDFLYSHTLSSIKSHDLENMDKRLCMLVEGDRIETLQRLSMIKSSDTDMLHCPSVLDKTLVENLIFYDLMKLCEKCCQWMSVKFDKNKVECSLTDKEVTNGNQEKVLKFVIPKPDEEVNNEDNIKNDNSSDNANASLVDDDNDENKDSGNQKCSLKNEYNSHDDDNDVNHHNIADRINDENNDENEHITSDDDNDDGEVDIIDADEKDDDNCEKTKHDNKKVTFFNDEEISDCNNEVKVELPSSVGNMVDGGLIESDKDCSVDRDCNSAYVSECLDIHSAFNGCGEEMKEITKVSKFGFAMLHQFEMQMMELQIKGVDLDIKMKDVEMKINQIRIYIGMVYQQPVDNWNQGLYHTVLYEEYEFKVTGSDFMSQRIKHPTMPKTDHFLPKKEESGRQINMLRYYSCTGRQCSDGNHGDRGNQKDTGGDKNKKNQRNEEDKNSRQNKKNSDDKNRNNNNNNNESMNKGEADINNDESALFSPASPTRTVEDSHVPENDYKGYRKKKHKIKNNFDWLEIVNNELMEKGGPYLELFSVLTDNEDVCVENCLLQQGNVTGESLSCFVCMTVDSLLKHFINCQSTYNGCNMCVKFFSLLCSHIATCISKMENPEWVCDVEICRTVIKMIPSVNIESHLKTLWFQVRKKFARSIEMTDVDEVTETSVKPEEVHEVPNKMPLVRKPSSGPLPSIPENSILPSTQNASMSVRRRISVRRPLGESGRTEVPLAEGDNPEEEMFETIDHGASGSDGKVERSEIIYTRAETLCDTDAMPTREDTGEIVDDTKTVDDGNDGSNDFSSNDSSGHTVKQFVSLPPTGPPCVDANYYPSFQDRPLGTRGIGEVVYADRKQMLVVVSVWEKFQIQYIREAKLAKHYREEGIILSKYKNKLKINKLRYNLEFQWVKISHLGNGMTGKCHLAMDFDTEFKFCVKEVHISHYEKDEIELMSALDHEYIVQVYGAIRHGERIYILQEFIEGGCLTEAINLQKKLGRRLSQQTALRHFQQLLKVLVYLKKCKILHEDIKADNILLDRNINDSSDPSSIKLTDFGVARRCQGTIPSGTKPIGTQTQWSPEKAEAVGYGYPAEVWAATCTLIHVLSGFPPWVRRFEEMKALILVIVDKSPPMEDIPRNILETIKDLIRQGFTVCQSERPTAEELLKHPAFQLLEEGSHASGIYSILESVPYKSNNLLPTTNSIEDSSSLNKKMITDHDLLDVVNLGINIPPSELTVCPVTQDVRNEGAAAAVPSCNIGRNVHRGDNAAGIDTSGGEPINNDRNNSSEYALQLLSQSQSNTSETTTPSPAQPSHQRLNDLYTLFITDEFPHDTNLPNLSIYEPSHSKDQLEKVNNLSQSDLTFIASDEATQALIPDLDQLLTPESDETLHQEDKEEKMNEFEALQEVIRQHVDSSSENSAGSLNVNIDDENSISLENVGNAGQVLEVGQANKVGHVPEEGLVVNTEKKFKVLDQFNIPDQDEIVESIRSLDITDDDLFAAGPTESNKSNVRKVRSETDMENNDRLPPGNQPQSAPPYLHPNQGSMLLGNQPVNQHYHPSLSPYCHQLQNKGQNYPGASLLPHGSHNNQAQYHGLHSNYNPRTSTPVTWQQMATQYRSPEEYSSHNHGNPGIYQPNVHQSREQASPRHHGNQNIHQPNVHQSREQASPHHHGNQNIHQPNVHHSREQASPHHHGNQNIHQPNVHHSREQASPRHHGNQNIHQPNVHHSREHASPRHHGNQNIHQPNVHHSREQASHRHHGNQNVYQPYQQQSREQAHHGNSNSQQSNIHRPGELFPANEYVGHHGYPNVQHFNPHQPRASFHGNVIRHGQPSCQPSSIASDRPPTCSPRPHYGPYNNSPDYTYWGQRIGQQQPRTPILNPSINPRAMLFPGSNKSQSQLQLDIKKAQQGTDHPISEQIQTAPVISPPKTPKKSLDLLRAMSVVPKATSRPTTSNTGLSSSPNDAMSTSTTSRSQFEEQEAMYKELGSTAMDALSQHSDPHTQWIDGNNIHVYHHEDDRYMGELNDDEAEVLADPAKSLYYLLDPEDNSITVKFISEENNKSLVMKFKSKYYNDSWRHIIETVLDGFTRHNMKNEYGLVKFNLKTEEGEIIDLDDCLGSENLVLKMSVARDTDMWWIERGMIY